jgi:hypothetical protein
MNSEAVDERICSLRMEGKFCNFTIISVHASMEEKEELFKDCFYNKLNQTHQRIPAHDTKIIVGDFKAKIGREVFRPVIRNCSLHETSNENGIRETDFATNNNMIIKSTYFSHINIHKEKCQSPDRRTNNQMDHILADGRNESSIMDVRSCKRVDCDLNHHLVQIKRQKISKYQNTHGARQRKCDVGKLKDSETIGIYMEQTWARIVQSVWRLAMGWTVWGSNPGGGKIFCTRPDRPWGLPQPPIQWVLGLSWG